MRLWSRIKYWLLCKLMSNLCESIENCGICPANYPSYSVLDDHECAQYRIRRQAIKVWGL